MSQRRLQQHQYTQQSHPVPPDSKHSYKALPGMRIETQQHTIDRRAPTEVRNAIMIRGMTRLSPPAKATIWRVPTSIALATSPSSPCLRIEYMTKYKGSRVTPQAVGLIMPIPVSLPVFPALMGDISKSWCRPVHSGSSLSEPAPLVATASAGKAVSNAPNPQQCFDNTVILQRLYDPVEDIFLPHLVRSSAVQLCDQLLDLAVVQGYQ